ncbi:MAG: hypothetical protein CL470_01675 [Acidimicrobiaceae bacterium]|nr:hypothetical protein [Acidimicrobiaceae bacterium]
MKASNRSETKFRKVEAGGYRISEVDRFMKKIAMHLQKNDKVSLSKELESIQFTLMKRSGYDPKEVDDHLDSLLDNPQSNYENLQSPKEQSTKRSSFTQLESKDIIKPGQRSIIESQKLRELTPPVVSGVGYAKDEVDIFLSTVADSLEKFEKAQGKDLDELRADQFIHRPEQKPLLAGDQIRYALFSVSDNGGYDMLGVDAAVNRLAEALDFHWNRKS